MRTLFILTALSLCCLCCQDSPRSMTAAKRQQEAPSRDRDAVLSPDWNALATPGQGPMATLLNAYDRYFTEAMKQHGIPGAAVVIVKDNNIVFCKGYGTRATGSNEQVDGSTVFRIGSLSKGFAGVLSAQLEQEGIWHLYDPVQRYFPEFTLRDPAQAERMTLENLLAHTSGLPYHTFTNMIEEGHDTRSIARMMPEVPILAPEGKLFSYQNVLFSIIGECMRPATGLSYAEVLEQKIFRPAGMSTASVTYEAMMQNPNRAMPHKGRSPIKINDHYYNSAPAGGINASAADMGMWLRLLLGHQPDIVSNEALDNAFMPRIRSQNERRRFRQWPGHKEAWYALGWRVLECEYGDIICHSGSVNEYRSEIAMNRQDGIGVCILFNVSTPLATSCMPEFFRRYDDFKNGLSLPLTGLSAF
jgi:beta-lactamase class C